MGDIVNLAARLMVAAGKLNSGLLCDETTYEGAQAKLSFRRLDPIMVKGKSEPIPIFVPQNKDEAELALEAVLADLEAGSGGVAVEVRQRLLCFAAVLSPTCDSLQRYVLQAKKPREIIGREKELKAIHEGMDKLTGSQKGSILVIEGPAGIGKVRDVLWFAPDDEVAHTPVDICV